MASVERLSAPTTTKVDLICHLMFSVSRYTLARTGTDGRISGNYCVVWMMSYQLRHDRACSDLIFTVFTAYDSTLKE